MMCTCGQAFKMLKKKKLKQIGMEFETTVGNYTKYTINFQSLTQPSNYITIINNYHENGKENYSNVSCVYDCWFTCVISWCCAAAAASRNKLNERRNWLISATM